jgi:hypothetical protein
LARLPHGGFVIPQVATPQMMTLGQALAGVEVPQPDPASWPGLFADVARPAARPLGHQRASIPAHAGVFCRSGGALLYLVGQEVAHGCRARLLAC